MSSVRVLTPLAGLSVAAVGVVVLIAWHARIESWVQVYPTFAAMQYNTALGFVLCGCGLLFLHLEWQRPALICGVLAALIGLPTLYEHLADVDLGIDELFMDADRLLLPSNPRRMAMTTAASFSVFSLTLVAASLPRRWAAPPVVLGLVGIGLAILGSVISIGYLSGADTTVRRVLITSMAVHTAGSFAALGGGLFVLAWRRDQVAEETEVTGGPRWLPVAIGLGTAVVTVVVWQVMMAREHGEIHRLLGAETRSVERRFADAIDTYTIALQRMARRWEVRGGTPEAEWRIDAAGYVEDLPGLRMLEWADASMRVRWSVAGGQATAFGEELDQHASVREAFEAAQASGLVVYSERVVFTNGLPGFVALVPLYTSGTFDGCIVGLLEASRFFEAMVADDVADRFAVTITGGGAELYTRSEPGDLIEDAWRHEVRLRLENIEWVASVYPSARLYAAVTTPLPEVALCAGLLLSGMLGVSISRMQAAYVRQREKIGGAYADLQREVAQREQVEADRLQIASALANSEAINAAVVQSSADGLITTRADGRIQSVNPAAERIFGYMAEELLGKKVNILMPSPYREEHDGYLERYIRTGEARMIGRGALELIGMRKDQTTFPLELSLTEARVDAQHLFVGAVRDITVRKRQELGLAKAHADLAEQARTIQLANDELSQYSYVVSHDLKTPLRAIHNYADFLLEDLAGSLDAEQEGYLHGLGRAVRQSEQLVDDLLDLSRIGRLAVKPHPIAVAGVIDQLRPVLELPEHTELIVAVDGAMIYGDEVLLHQILQNLVTNAVKFNDKPHKRVEIGWTSVEAESACEVFVRDNGIGIADQYQEQIFRVFQRLHTDEEYTGTGIGLAIVKKAVDRLGGTLRLESQVGAGTTFYVRVPTPPPTDLAS